MPAEHSNHNVYSQKIRRLARHEQERGGELLTTLETYLQRGGNALKTARQLNIHRSTLAYRLKRIEDLCEVDLSDPLVRLNLQIALQMHYLHNRTP